MVRRYLDQQWHGQASWRKRALRNVRGVMAIQSARRSWLRISLRSFFLLIIGCALWLAWQGSKAIQQRKALAAIRANGGTVHFDWEFAGPDRKRLTWQGEDPVPPGPAIVRKAIGDAYFQDVWEVSLRAPSQRGTAQGTVSPGSRPRLKDLAPLANLRDLRSLTIDGYSIEDRELSFLRGMPHLEHLSLAHTDVSGAGLRQIANRRLESLNLRVSAIDDRGLSEIGKLQSLRNLDLSGTPITNAGLAQLASLKNLQELRLDETRVDDSGLAHLAGLTGLAATSLVAGEPPKTAAHQQAAAPQRTAAGRH